MKDATTRHAFTLIELLLVLVILAVLASIVGVGVAGRLEGARRTGTIAEIASLKSALAHFEVDNGRYPSSAEGLEALITPPAGLENTWTGRYIERDRLPLDKWGHAYMYAYPGTADTASYDLVSAAKDGVFATEDDIDKYTER